MFISKRRIIQIVFLIPALLLGLLVTPSSYAKNPVQSIYGPVTGSDTLGKIVARHYPRSDLSSQQIMTGILRKNPESFIGGNIHFLLRGSTLHLPSEALIATIDQRDAVKIINEHYLYFKRGKTGNFNIEPLEASGNDVISDFEKNASSILSGGFDAPDAEENNPQLSKGNSLKVTQNTPEKEKPTRQKTTDSSIKDIELESLKIKVSQLEKILAKRRLSSDADTTNTSDEISKELKKTLQTQKEKIDLLEQDRNNKNKELDKLQLRITELETTLKKRSTSLSDNKSPSTSADKKDELISQLKKENIALEEKLSALQVELNKKTKEVVGLTHQINQSKQKIGQLESKLLNSNKENANLDQQIIEAEAKLAKIRQEPTKNLANNTASERTTSFGVSPWIWLLPALFLLSILAYLFKRSFSPSKNTLSTAKKVVKQRTEKSETILVEDRDEALNQKTTSEVAAAISSVPDIISSANEEESTEAAIKLDIGKAYLDMDMPDAAIEILQEAYEEGSEKQRLDAKTLLEKLG